MALDLNKIRARLNELNGNQKAKEDLWKPTEGKNRVRIVPLADSPDNPFIELYFHRIMGKTYLSPRSYGERDPIAEFGESLRSEGDLSKEDWQKTKQFIPYRRVYVPVVDRKNPAAGVKLWAFGKTVHTELLTVMADVEEYGDITDIKSGRDISVTFVPQEKSDTNFAKTTIQMAGSSSPLTDDAKLLKVWLTEQPNVNNIYQRSSFDELKAVLERFVDPSGPTKPSSVEESEPEAPSPTVTRAKKKTVEDVEDEFSSLFEN